VGALIRQVLSGRAVKIAEKLGKVDAGDFFVQDNIDWIIKEFIHFGKELF